MLVFSDRVKESSISEGSGSITLDAPFGSFQSFSKGIGTELCIIQGSLTGIKRYNLVPRTSYLLRLSRTCLRIGNLMIANYSQIAQYIAEGKTPLFWYWYFFEETDGQ
jgi:hypothetical protein